MVGDGGAPAVTSSARSKIRSLEVDESWWTSTVITLVPATSRLRAEVQSNVRYALPASRSAANVDAVIVPLGIDGRASSVPFRYTTAPSSYISSPIIEVTAAGSATVKRLRK